jgi:tRNA U34 5-carboxymethylaminomethyl modifying GTPase MnmE/TrmE
MATNGRQAEPVRSGKGAFEAAVRSAVVQSLDAVHDLEVKVNAALSAIEDVIAHARLEVGRDNCAMEVVDDFQREIDVARNDARDLFIRQRAVLTTVNIALFGRTGAGKSSLIEPLIGGDGASVSTGESDFTTDVRKVCWRGCRFFDTPGING